MSAKRLSSSLGVFLSEIDNSQLPRPGESVPLLLLGASGLTIKPVKVSSFQILRYGRASPRKRGGRHLERRKWFTSPSLWTLCGPGLS